VAGATWRFGFGVTFIAGTAIPGWRVVTCAWAVGSATAGASELFPVGADFVFSPKPRANAIANGATAAAASNNQRLRTALAAGSA
jgi:hypothetical protein